jgi:hypothetical protein
MRALSISDPIELSHHCGGEVPIDPAALGREQAFAEGEDLRGKAEVDRELEEERLAIRADVGNGLAKLAEQGQSHRECLEVAPTMMTKVPASAWGTLPDNGASSIAAPSSRTRPESSTLASGLTVLMSTYSLPGLSAARIPSGPSLMSFSALSSVTMLNVTSAAAATSRGCSSRPCRGRSAALPWRQYGSCRIRSSRRSSNGSDASPYRAEADDPDRVICV